MGFGVASAGAPHFRVRLFTFAVVFMTLTASVQDSGELLAPAILLLVQALELLGLELDVLLRQCVHDLFLRDEIRVLHYVVRLLGLHLDEVVGEVRIHHLKTIDSASTGVAGPFC